MTTIQDFGVPFVIADYVLNLFDMTTIQDFSRGILQMITVLNLFDMTTIQDREPSDN